VFGELTPPPSVYLATQNAEQTVDRSTTAAVLDSSSDVVLWSNGDTNVFEQYNNNENHDEDKLTKNINTKRTTLICL